MNTINPNKASFAVVLPAGGLGKRMGSSIPKQLLSLRGKPVYFHSLETFLSMDEIAEVILVVPKDWKSHFEQELLDGNALSKEYQEKLKIVEGGKERWESVKQGVLAISKSSHVLVHDVARPFISKDIIRESCLALETKGACIVARPVNDTVKVVQDGVIQNTLDRTTVWLAQTPQSCSVELLKSLYKKIEQKPLDFVPTDESSILEYFNIPVYVIRGDALNDKITTPEDWERFSSNSFYKNQ